MAKVGHWAGNWQAEKQILRCASGSGRWNSKVRKFDKIPTWLHTASAKTFRIWALVARLCSPMGNEIYPGKHSILFFFDNPFSLGQRNFRSSLFLYRNQKFFFSTDICSRDSWKKFGPYLFAISNLHIERKKKRIKFELHISFPIRKEILLKCVNFGKSLIRMEIASCNLIFSRVKKWEKYLFKMRIRRNPEISSFP